jgi:hypothetical protein
MHVSPSTRRYRRRQRHGLKCVRVQIFDPEIDALVAQGLLAESEKSDRKADQSFSDVAVLRVMLIDEPLGGGGVEFSNKDCRFPIPRLHAAKKHPSGMGRTVGR